MRSPIALAIGLLISSAFIMAGCELAPFPPSNPTPTIDVSLTPSPTITERPSPSPAASPTLPQVPQLESPTPTFTPGPPTATPTTTPTLGPYEHTISQGETLIQIIQRYGYDDLGVIDMIVALNPNIPNADSLPGAGSVILIPRQTATPTPPGYELTVTSGGVTEIAELPANAPIIQHSVREGETIIGIVGQYNTTLSVIDRLNPELVFINCDFDNPSGGPDCGVQLLVGQLLNVPAPTPTPTLSPTPSGSETATLTPTYAAPLLIFPPQGAIARGRSVNLQWVSIGILKPEEVYLVEVEDTTAQQNYFNITRETSYTLEAALAPADGQPHMMRWRIRVGIANEAGAFRPVSAETPWREFRWEPGG